MWLGGEGGTIFNTGNDLLGLADSFSLSRSRTLTGTSIPSLGRLSQTRSISGHISRNGRIALKLFFMWLLWLSSGLVIYRFSRSIYERTSRHPYGYCSRALYFSLLFKMLNPSQLRLIPPFAFLASTNRPYHQGGKPSLHNVAYML